MSSLPPPPPPAPPPPPGPASSPWPAPAPIDRAPGAITRPGWHYVPPPSALPVGAPRRRRAPFVALAVLVLVGAVAFVYNRQQGPGWAKAWDPRIEPLARFVEQHRGLRFTHPVKVTFVPEQAFVDEMAKSETAATPQAAPGRDRDEPELPLWQATGLVGDDFTQEQSSADAANGITGVYSPVTHQIRVRGEELSASVRVTLVHELTHALQDQHFGLETVRGKADSNASDTAILGVVEGDATAVENEYIGQLSDRDYAALTEQEGAVGDSPALDRVPGALLTSIQMPYALGPGFVETVDALGGAGARDRLFTDPPMTDVELMYPDLYLRGVTEATVEVPELRDGEEWLEDGDLGAFTWAMILGARLDAHEVSTAVQGWAGDAYVAFRRNGQVCSRAVVKGADEARTKALDDALVEWMGLGPGGTATVTMDDGVVTVETCDDGTGKPAEDAHFDAVLGLLSIRSDVVAPGPSAADTSKDLATRTCLGDAVVAELTEDELADLSAVTDERYSDIRVAAGTRCGTTF